MAARASRASTRGRSTRAGVFRACSPSPARSARRLRKAASSEVELAGHDRWIAGLTEAFTFDAEGLLDADQQSIVGSTRFTQVDVSACFQATAPATRDERGDLTGAMARRIAHVAQRD